MTDFLARVTANTATRADFEALAALFGKPTKADAARGAELAAALAEHRDAMQRTFAIPKLWDQITARDALKAEHEARVREIEARHDARRYVRMSIDLTDEGGSIAA